MSDTDAPTRRGFLRTACSHCIGAGAVGTLLPSFAQGAADSTLVPARFSRPLIESDEGGLWALMDREETKLRRGSFVIRDEALNNWARDLVCKLGGDHCPDIRVHLVRTPHFNASMAPNGMMQVWSGLLLRAENEAQLAAVIGHELGHYLERHTLQRMQDMKNKAALGTFLAVFGLAGAIASIGVYATAFAFSREQEERADRFGMHLMKRAGYDGAQAAQVWDNLLGEMKIRGGDDVGKRSVMFGTHPPVENRRDELLKLAGNEGGNLGADTYQKMIAPHRLDWLKDEVRRGQFEESLILFGRMLKARPDDAEVLYARGEAYRHRDGEGDLLLALDDLTRATAFDAAPVDSYRALGYLHRKRSDAGAAHAAFERYLALAPESPDAGIIKTYLTQAKP
ncbi:MAG TPA: M48 family metallopeptidase [Ramlibacter sp.]|nr:M48 family metallopeptidase [Ramlibacter sp.]